MQLIRVYIVINDNISRNILRADKLARAAVLGE